MYDLTRTMMFGLFSETSQQISNEEMQEAYDEFLEHIESVSNGTGYSVIHRTLNATRIEIASLEALVGYSYLKELLRTPEQNHH